MKKEQLIWEKITHSGKHHAILFIDTVFKGYQEGVISDFFQIDFNPTHYRQFNGARWWFKEEINNYMSILKEKEKEKTGFLLQKAEEYEKLNQDFLIWGQNYKNHDFTKDNDLKLKSIFSEFVRQLSKINALVYTSIMFDRFYTDEIVQLVTKHERDFDKQQKDLNTIFSIDWGLETHFERESLLFIAEQMKKKKSLTPNIELLIKKHVERFAHLSLMPFYGHPTDKKKVLTSIKNLLNKDIKKEKAELKKNKAIHKKVEKIIKQLNLNKDDTLKIKTLRKWMFIANNDDHYVIGSIYALWNLWREIAKRFNLLFDQFVEMRIEEIKKGLKEGSIPKKFRKELVSRQKANALIWDEKGTRLLIGKDLDAYSKKEIQAEEEFHHIKEVRGQPASPGKVIGIVQIITDIRDINKVKKNNVLVTIYTYPAIVVAMEKASAIVTDQGGLLSHAAIVSRELGKPCIVGTKVGTKIFKDNDLVEVDANKGIVKLLKRK